MSPPEKEEFNLHAMNSTTLTPPSDSEINKNKTPQKHESYQDKSSEEESDSPASVGEYRNAIAKERREKRLKEIIKSIRSITGNDEEDDAELYELKMKNTELRGEVMNRKLELTREIRINPCKLNIFRRQLIACGNNDSTNDGSKIVNDEEEGKILNKLVEFLLK